VTAEPKFAMLTARDQAEAGTARVRKTGGDRLQLPYAGENANGYHLWYRTTLVPPLLSHKSISMCVWKQMSVHRRFPYPCMLNGIHRTKSRGTPGYLP